MTPEKAIKFFDEEIVRLEGAPIINGCEMTDDWQEMLEICKLAKAALEKQIPKKLDLEADGYADGVLAYDYAKCRVCEHDFEEGVNDWGCVYCQDCGQALDWSDTE